MHFATQFEQTNYTHRENIIMIHEVVKYGIGNESIKFSLLTENRTPLKQNIRLFVASQ